MGVGRLLLLLAIGGESERGGEGGRIFSINGGPVSSPLLRQTSPALSRPLPVESNPPPSSLCFRYSHHIYCEEGKLYMFAGRDDLDSYSMNLYR